MARPIKYNAEYFSHDADMRNDLKIKALRGKFGMTGYAVWTMILEVLTDADEFKYPWDAISKLLMAADFGIESSELDEIVSYCIMLNLLSFSEDGKWLFCEKHISRLNILVTKRKRDRERFKPSETNSDKEIIAEETTEKEVIAAKTTEKCDFSGESTQSKVKESKVKESKEYNIANQRLACDNSLSPAAVSSEQLKKDSPEKSETTSPPPSREKDAEVDFKKVIELYHENCQSFPRVFKLSDARKAKIRIRLEEMKNDYSVLEKIFKKMGDSKFLKGDNKNGWKASFDWVFENERNWVKIIEGNYDNKQPHNGPAINPVNHPSATFKNDKKYEQF